MKNKILIIFLSNLIGLSAFGQLPNYKAVKDIKNSKIIVGLSDNQDLNNNLVESINKYWNINPIEEALPLQEAVDKAKENDNTYIIYIGEMSNNSLNHKKEENWDIKYITAGVYVGLTKGKINKPVMRSFIPTTYDLIPNESIIYGVKFMQTIISSMIKEEKEAMGVLSKFRKQGERLANKTLYIPKAWIDKKLTKEIIEEEYKPSKFKLVDEEEWKDAIVNKKTNVAYLILVPIPVGGQYIFQHHIFDSETDYLYAISQSRTGVSPRQIKRSKVDTDYITKKHIKKYKEIHSGKW